MTRLAFDGPVRTLDPSRPFAPGIEIDGGVVARLGACDGPRLPPGAVLVPGFVDAHSHLMACAAARLSVDCSPDAAPSISALLATLRGATPASGWIRAHGYDDAMLRERRHPTTSELDAATALPCVVHHATGHVVAANTPARRALGLPLSEEPLAAALVAGRTPRLDRTALLAALRDAGDDLSAHGVTAVCDATFTNGPSEVSLLASAGLRQRVVAMVGASRIAEVVAAGMRFAAEHPGVRVGPAKLYVDDDDSPRDLAAIVEHAHARGWPVALHVLDVGPLDVSLHALEASAPPPGTCDRLEHVALCLPEQVGRIARSGAAVVTQPSFVARRGAKYAEELSEVEHDWLYRVRSLREAGVTVGFSSDAPVVPADPCEWMAAATSRALGAVERVDAEAALRMATADAAAVCGLAGGMLREGAPGDAVVLSGEPGDARTHVLTTVVAGEVAYDRA